MERRSGGFFDCDLWGIGKEVRGWSPEFMKRVVFAEGTEIFASKSFGMDLSTVPGGATACSSDLVGMREQRELAEFPVP